LWPRQHADSTRHPLLCRPLTRTPTPPLCAHTHTPKHPQGLDRQRLARLSVESYLQQILTHGFFHADPHPGNVAVDAVGGGRLIYYGAHWLRGVRRRHAASC
jgi:hypothetical protein